MISVVVCTHNRCAFLGPTLARLVDLEPPPGGYELVMVNNASSDGTREVIERAAGGAQVPMRYVEEPRPGHSLALNAGIAQARGQIIAFTDDDALPAPDWLVRIESSVRRHDAGIVFGRVEPIWEDGMPSWYSDRFRNVFALLDYGDRPFVVEGKQHPFYGVNHAVRRAVLDRLGGYDEAAGAVGAKGGKGNDFDLFERAMDAGIRVVYDPDAVVGHRIVADRCSKREQRRRLRLTYEAHYRDMLARCHQEPWLFGMPRWRYRVALGHLASWIKSSSVGDESESFFHELRLRQFLGLWSQFLTVRAGSGGSVGTGRGPAR